MGASSWRQVVPILGRIEFLNSLVLLPNRQRGMSFPSVKKSKRKYPVHKMQDVWGDGERGPNAVSELQQQLQAI